jgi:hypothetical protein
MFILGYETGIYKPTATIVPPPISRITADARMAGIFHYLFLLNTFDPNEWCVKNSLLGS